MKLNEKIYIRLFEGAISYVPVIAKPINSDIFQIIENEYLDLESDVTSIWEFFPEDIVRTEISNNMVMAKELIGSSFPNRKIYELIFKIVESLGKIPLDSLYGYSKEIEQLLKDPKLIQRNHPIVDLWISNNFK